MSAWLPIAEVAVRLQVAPAHVTQLRRCGALRSYYTGGGVPVQLPGEVDRIRRTWQDDGMSGVAQFEVYPDGADEWRWRLRAANGEIVAQGESHQSEDHARRAAATAGITAQTALGHAVQVISAVDE